MEVKWPSGFAQVFDEVSVNSILLAVEPSSSFENWKNNSFTPGELAIEEISGEQPDPDNDGLSNLLEYAFNHDPMRVDAGYAIPSGVNFNTQDSKEYFIFTYRRRKPPLDIAYRVEVSEDLANWNSGSMQSEEISVADGGDGEIDIVTVRIKPSIGDANLRYVRVVISRL